MGPQAAIGMAAPIHPSSPDQGTT